MKKNLGRHLKHPEPWQTPRNFADFKKERITYPQISRNHQQTSAIETMIRGH
jgi:hypothetical protein